MGSHLAANERLKFSVKFTRVPSQSKIKWKAKFLSANVKVSGQSLARQVTAKLWIWTWKWKTHWSKTKSTDFKQRPTTDQTRRHTDLKRTLSDLKLVLDQRPPGLKRRFQVLDSDCRNNMVNALTMCRIQLLGHVFFFAFLQIWICTSKETGVLLFVCVVCQ